MINKIFLFVFFLFIPLSSLFAIIDGQIIVNPDNPGWLIYENGEPFFMCGPGDPEGFLYRGTRLADGTRQGDQDQLIDKMKNTGANCIYLMAFRSHGGDGSSSHNPFIDSDPSLLIDDDILNQWDTWFSKMDSLGIVIYFFLYDDDVCPNHNLWNTGDVVGAQETYFVSSLVNKFEHYKKLIWVIKEEYAEGFSATRISNIASLIRQEDDYNHPIAVHKNVGTNFDEFADDPNINQFAIQLSGNAENLHQEVAEAWHNADSKYSLNMSEAASHGTGQTMRRKNWACAMAGAYVMVLGMDIASTSEQDLNSCGYLRKFFERTVFQQMEPSDSLADGHTKYVMALSDSAYILYSETDGPLGIKGITNPGFFSAKWLNTLTGDTLWQSGLNMAAGTNFLTRPSGFEDDVAVYLFREGFDQTLPVKLENSSLHIYNNEAVLSWKSSQEIDLLGYEIFSKIDIEKKFRLRSSYKSNINLMSKGNHSFGYRYTFSENITHSANTITYRVNAVNVDNSRSTLFEKKGNWGQSGDETVRDFKVYPNPFNHSFNIKVILDNPDGIEMSVINLLGQRVYSFKSNFFVQGENNIHIDMKIFKSGIYFVILKSKTGQIIRKIHLIK